MRTEEEIVEEIRDIEGKLDKVEKLSPEYFMGIGKVYGMKWTLKEVD